MKKEIEYYRLVQIQITETRKIFESLLANKLNLIRVSAPLIVDEKSGLNDRLTGIEKTIDFSVKSLNKTLEIVQSLAKWKRVAIERYAISLNEGIYTNMNALRKDEIVDDIHSVYVDQWDWEVRISRKDRNIDVLKKYVIDIFDVLKETQKEVHLKYNMDKNILPEDIFFITSRALEDLYPNLEPNEREYEIAKKHKAVFIIGIGWSLKSKKRHDARSPDYDDWNLNGDLIVWDEIVNRHLEISSMGIRVDSDSLTSQLKECDNMDRMQFDYHQKICNNELPFTIGGGIGQSRVCMFLLNKKHIGEVQCSVWSDEIYSSDKYKIL